MCDSIQTLRIVPRLFPLILSGEKTSTIRWKETRIVPGPMRYICNDDPTRVAIVTVLRCTDMPLSAAAEFLGKGNVWPDDTMLSGMRDHYPGITLADIVQVIEHAPFTGG